ncbi:MAG: efflux RND transporter permease subunit, partial [Verrucomicrobia bacterium]|nr:efflux RND transporter permease subunit [Verrucomicrobiota bacterium]
AQFESLIHPFTVMLALPLAAVGAFGLLWLLAFLGKTGVIPVIPSMNINLFSQIGLVLLIGLVTKNSILLVEYANQRAQQGIDPVTAMMEAGKVRLRPILMTAFSTVAGIMPIAIGFGAGAESRRPMGVAVVGGMLTSTFLTLYVIPVVYVLLDRWFPTRSMIKEEPSQTLPAPAPTR